MGYLCKTFESLLSRGAVESAKAGATSTTDLGSDDLNLEVDEAAQLEQNARPARPRTPSPVEGPPPMAALPGSGPGAWAAPVSSGKRSAMPSSSDPPSLRGQGSRSGSFRASLHGVIGLEGAEGVDDLRNAELADR